MKGTQFPMRERSGIMLRFVLAAAVAVLSSVTFGDAYAQRFTPSFNSVGPRGPSMSVGPRGPGFDRPIIVRTAPADQDVVETPTTRTVKKKQNGGGGPNPAGMPPAGETHFVPDEVVVVMTGDPEPMARRHRLIRLERLDLGLTGQPLYRWQITGGRSVREVIRQLAA